MKFNMGCGQNKLSGYVNVDMFEECMPDQVVDLEQLPWPWADNCANEVVFNHSLEHLGADYRVFLGLMKELYRICKDGAVISIAVPHPRHDNFVNDPGHVRIITPEVLSLFSQRNNKQWRQHGAANSPYALYLGVDFEVRKVGAILDPSYVEAINAGRFSKNDISTHSRERNNVISEYRIELVVLKHSRM